MELIYRLSGKMRQLCIYSALFLVPLVFWLPANESFEMPKTASLVLLISLSLAITVFRAFYEGKFLLSRPSFTHIAHLILLSCVLSAVSGLFVNVHAWQMYLQFFLFFFAPILLYFLIINTFSREALYKLLFFIIISHAITALYGVFQYAGVDFVKWVSFGKGRVYSTMGNPDYMSAQFTILLPVILALIFSPVSKLLKFSLSLLSCALIFLIVAAQGRGAWIAFAVMFVYLVIVFGISYGRVFFKRYRLFLASVLIILAVIVALKSEALTARVKHGLNMTSDSVAVRLFYWESALQMGMYNPLFGAGLGGFSMNTAYYQRKVLDRWEHAAPEMAQKVEPHVELYVHNDFLQQLSETGFFGLGVFLLFCFVLVYGPLKRSFTAADPVSRNILLGLSAGGIAFIVNGTLNFPWRVVITVVLLWSLFACYSLLEEQRRRKITLPLSKTAGLIAGLLIMLIPSVSVFSAFFANHSIRAGQGEFMRGGHMKAAGIFERALAANARATDTIELLLYSGNAYNAAKDIDKAVDYYNRGLKMFPHFIESHYNVGNVYMNNLMYDKALAEYDAALALNPKFSSALNNKANIYFNTGDFAKAKEMYKKALSIKPSGIEARFNLAAVYYREGNYSEALKEFREIKKYPPADPKDTTAANTYRLAEEWAVKIESSGIR